MSEIEAIKEKLCRFKSQLDALEIESKTISERIVELEHELDFLEFAEGGENE